MNELRWQCPACLTTAEGDVATAKVMMEIGWHPIGNVPVDGWRMALCPRCAKEQAGSRCGESIVTA